MCNLATCLVAVLLMPSPAALHAADAPKPAGKPNIIFINADDWGWGDLSCHGHPHLKTPNLDRLASEGMDFHQFNVLNPVCSPSRTAAMTGQFPARWRVHQHFAAPTANEQRGMPNWLDPKAPMLPRMLKEAGYRTGHFGKWHFTSEKVPNGPPPSDYGIDEFKGFNYSKPNAGMHETADNTVAFIRANKDRPFYVNVWLHESHLPHVPTQESQAQWKDLPKGDRIYAAVITDGDNAVGKVLAALNELELEKNTIVIFSSDNGPESGQGGSTGGLRGRKRSLFEGGVCVPFIVRWPGHTPAGKVDKSTVVAAVDLLPTLCAAAEVPLPTDYKPDGENMLPAFTGKEIKRTQPIFWEWQGKATQPDYWPRLAVREGDWKLVMEYDKSRMELYNIADDRSEKKDVAAGHPEIVARLSKLALDWKATLPKSTAPGRKSGAAPAKAKSDED